MAPARESVWLARRPERGKRPGGLDRGKIVAEAVRLLDAEGEARFSMRRLAAELDVTPMSLYWYVATKDDLLELALDAVAGEIAPGDPARGWRDELRALVSAWRRTMVAHPWALRCYGDYLNIGPESLRFARRARIAVDRSPLEAEDRAAALAALFEYVYGFAVTESRWLEHARKAGRSVDECVAELAAPLAGQLPEGGVAARSRSVAEQREHDFGRALDWLFAGMTRPE